MGSAAVEGHPSGTGYDLLNGEKQIGVLLVLQIKLLHHPGPSKACPRLSTLGSRSLLLLFTAACWTILAALRHVCVPAW